MSETSSSWIPPGITSRRDGEMVRNKLKRFHFEAVKSFIQARVTFLEVAILRN